MTTNEITETNAIICGDCRDQLARIPDGSVDLIYLDPPFFSGKNYEIIWGDGSEIRSFTDTEFYTLVCKCGEIFPNGDIFCGNCGASRDEAILKKSKDIEAYLQWLRQRLERCRDVLKNTGSIYCHLDWHAVHYVKVMMDEIFGYGNLRNEIVWCYRGVGMHKRMFKRKHDTILFYNKSNDYTFNLQYKRNNVTLKIARIYEDWWDDIRALGSRSKERLGYPTQKPEALLKRIIETSSNPGDVVLDPFCGSGTTIAVAQKLGRKWIGIDISPTACKIMTQRLRSIRVHTTEVDIIDLPRTCTELRKMEPFEFQNLVINKLGGKQDPKKFSESEMDGWTYKIDDLGMRHRQMGLDVVVQVKRSDKIPRQAIEMFVGAMIRDHNNTDGKHGIFVAFGFTKSARMMVKELMIKRGISIKLITVKELFDCE